jgi:polysaccharide biosynthesis protein PslJ
VTRVETWAAEPRRAAPFIVAGLGLTMLLAGIAIGDRAVAYGAAAFLFATLLALGESYGRVFTWKAGIVSLILVIWFIPIKKYRLPVDLPFDLEPYRLLILLLGFLWVLTFISGRATVSAGSQRAPLILLAVVSIGALIMNIGRISDAGLQTQSIKSLSFFLSFLVAFVLISSALRTRDELNAAVQALVIGGVIIALAAVYERQSRTNVFNHLNEWIPLLEFDGQVNENVRAGRLRVRASAQHPIALAAALVMCLPLALYLAQAASTRIRSALWTAGGVAVLVASFATISRTSVLMLLGIVATALWLRHEALFRRENLLRLLTIVVVVVLVVKVAAPGSLRTLYAAFTPQGGLISEQQRRAGDEGSGRIADLGPAVDLWLDRPVLGRALGTGITRADSRRERNATEGVREPRIIFDNQYLGTMVYLGLVGLIAVLWFVWSTVRKLGVAARRVGGVDGDLLVACAASCAGYGVSLAVFDAFAFVQASLIFFAIAALGLRMRALTSPA